MPCTKTRLSLLAAAAIAFAAPIPASPAQAVDTPPGSDATVLVKNHNSLDVQIFAVTECGKRFELGTVNRNSERSLALPERLLDEATPFRLKIYSLARALQAEYRPKQLAAVKTQPLSPAVGEEIQLNIRSPLVASFIDRGQGQVSPK